MTIKKAMALLALVGLILITATAIYIFKYHPDPLQFDPVWQLLKQQVDVQFHSPILVGLGIFYLSVLFISVITLFERRPAIPEKNRETDLETELECLKNELQNSQQENEALKQSLKEEQNKSNKFKLEADALATKIESIEARCENEAKSAEKTADKLKKAEAELAKNQELLKSANTEIEELRKELQKAVADARSGKNGIPPAAFQILYLFQKEGRLIDLLMEDISEIDDETLGGAIRPIHEGCRKLLQERLILKPVLDEEEGSEITIDEADPGSIKLSGNVPEKGPYTGELVHKGWRLEECHLPELVDGWSDNVVAPAEIEITA